MSKGVLTHREDADGFILRCRSLLDGDIPLGNIQQAGQKLDYGGVCLSVNGRRGDFEPDAVAFQFDLVPGAPGDYFYIDHQAAVFIRNHLVIGQSGKEAYPKATRA